MRGVRAKGARWHETPYGRLQLLTPAGFEVCTVTWVSDAVAARRLDADEREALPARRQEILAGIMEVRPHRDRRPPVVEPLEKNGDRMLEAEFPARAKRPWICRVHYVSMGGEKVYAEFGGLTCAQASSLAAQWRGIADIWEVRRPRNTKCRGLAEDDAMARFYPNSVGTCGAHSWCACRGSGWVETPPPAPRHGHRQVVFPTERPEHAASIDDTDRSCIRCESEGLCEPDCRLAPWNLDGLAIDEPECAEDSQPAHGNSE